MIIYNCLQYNIQLLIKHSKTVYPQHQTFHVTYNVCGFFIYLYFCFVCFRVTWEETQTKIKIEVDTSIVKTEPIDTYYENTITNSTFSNLCGTFNCKICFEVFNNYEEFIVHKNLAHKNILKYECQICNEKFNLSAHLNSHMLSHIHIKNTSLALPSTTQSSSSSDLTKKQKRKSNCKIIEVKPYNKNSKSSFNNEYNSYRCKLCFKSYVNQTSLNGHMRFHGLKGHIISKRNLKIQRLNNRQNINNVVRSENENFAINKKSLMCNICNKGFVLQKRLAIHMQLHKSVKNSKQNSTGKSLKHKNVPKIAVKFGLADVKIKKLNQLHNIQLKPFQCPHCENYYSSKKTLSEHTRQFHNYAVSKPWYKIDV